MLFSDTLLSSIIALSVLGVIVVLLIIFTVITIKNNILLKRLTKNENGKDISQIIKEYYDKSDVNTANINKILEKFDLYEKNQALAIQKCAFVKFDSFDDVSGKLSFALALLDGNNNGVVVTNLFGRSGNNIYIKEIKNASCDSSLSEYEAEAIKQAVKSFDEQHTDN